MTDRTTSMLRVAVALLAGAVVVLVGVTLWGAYDNPTIPDTSRGDYTCLAPWDTVLNDDPNQPTGEPPGDADEIAARCREAGEDRFRTGTIAGLGAGGAALGAVGCSVLAYRRDRRP